MGKNQCLVIYAQGVDDSDLGGGKRKPKFHTMRKRKKNKYSHKKYIKNKKRYFMDSRF